MSASQISQVKEATDIVALINERVPLQRSGQNYRANCPFHGEKSPSFFVNETIQRYKCFGCGESGDAFTFLEKFESMTFAEALQFLAQQAGIALQEFKHSKEDDEREQLLAILNLTKEYYHFLLEKHEAGGPAQEYLKGRGVHKESRTVFQLGYAPDAWDGLISYLHKKKKYSLALLEKAGLIIKGKAGRYYDRFRNRVVFPLTNQRGQVVGFSGRTLDPDTKTAKYINSPETVLYHKSELLFGYSQLRQFIRQQQSVIVTEGEMDVISSAQAHVNNVVALKGSALTEQQAALLDRVADKVILALDADSAGIEATKRAIAVSAKRNYELRVILLPEGKDPDQLAQTKPELWRQTAKGSVSVPDFFLTVLQKQHDSATPEGKREIMKEMVAVLQSVDHAVERDFYIKKLAGVLGVRESLVREDLRKDSKQQKSGVRSGAAAEKRSAPSGESKVAVAPSLSEFEIQILAIILSNQAHTAERVKALLEATGQQVQSNNYARTLLQSIATFLDSKPAKGSATFVLADWVKTLAGDQQQLIMDIIADPQLDFSDETQAEKIWQQLKKKWQQLQIQQRISTITQRLNSLDSIDDKSPEQEAEQQQLLLEVVALKAKA